MSIMLISHILGVYMIVSGLFLVFRGKTLPLLLKDFLDHRSVVWLAGLILLIFGGLLSFGDTGSSWVSLLGWLILAKGIVYILAPELLAKFAKPKSRPLVIFLGLLVIALGLTLLSTW